MSLQKQKAAITCRLERTKDANVCWNLLRPTVGNTHLKEAEELVKGHSVLASPQQSREELWDEIP